MKIPIHKIKSVHFIHLFILLVFFTGFSSCGTSVGSIIPNDKQEILKFSVTNRSRSVYSTNTKIDGTNITVNVPAGTDISKLLPEAQVSEQAVLLPLTLRYMQEAFPNANTADISNYITHASNGITALDNYFYELYKQTPNFKLPEFSFPINFISTVHFAVIGGTGNVTIYSVKTLYDDGSDPENPPPPPEPAEKDILTFDAPNQLGNSIIKEQLIDFVVKSNADLKSVIPVVTISEGAVAVPFTLDYLEPLMKKIGNNTQEVLDVLSGFVTAKDKERYLSAVFEKANTQNLKTVIDKPIDFTKPVMFAVIGKDKTVKLYTVIGKAKTEGLALSSFVFSKYKNTNLMEESYAVIDNDAKTVQVELLYPAGYISKNPNSLNLQGEAEHNGTLAELEYNGKTFSINSSRIPFAPEKTSEGNFKAKASLIIKNDSTSIKYNFTAVFKEVPIKQMVITDFRFEKELNSGIIRTSVAEITENEEEGIITANVLYSGNDIPSLLIPSFICTGTLFADDEIQKSGEHSRNFSISQRYVCASDKGQNPHNYIVKIKFIKINPSFELFEFTKDLNSGIFKNAEGEIDNEKRTIHVTVIYNQQEIPENLFPVFSVTGIAKVNGIKQTSGFDSQNFKSNVKYVLFPAEYPNDISLSKEYTVFVEFKKSECELISMSLKAENNKSLQSDVSVKINQKDFTGYAFLPRTANLSNLIPTFKAKGNVEVNGIKQESGVTEVDFSQTVKYTVVSEYGETKKYSITIQKPDNIIYVNENADGRNNGTNWTDAFTSVELALKDANSVPETYPIEIWITKNTSSKNKKYEIKRNMILRGGFNGNESSYNQRETQATTSFKSSSFYSPVFIKGMLLFDSFDFSSLNESDYKLLDEVKWKEDAADSNNITFENCVLNKGVTVLRDNNDLNSFVLSSIILKKGSKINMRSPSNSINIKNVLADGELNFKEYTQTIILESSTFNTKCSFFAKDITGTDIIFGEDCVFKIKKEGSISFKKTTARFADISINAENTNFLGRNISGKEEQEYYFDITNIQKYQKIFIEDSKINKIRLREAQIE